jgi:hypothetical protein
MRSTKAIFPSEWLDDYNKLNESKLPEYDLDMFKDAISLPGLAYKMLINCPNANFSLFEEQYKHLYYMLKNNIRGGPSIIFNRYQEVDKTLIRGNKLCKIVICFDANALYLWANMQGMSIGMYYII